MEDCQRIDRRIGWIISLGGAALILGQAPILLAASGDYPFLWNLCVAALAAMVLCLAGAGWALPHRVLTGCWRAGPVLGAALILTSFLGYQGPKEPELLPWILAFDATLSTYLLLWMPPWAAASGTVLGALLVPASALSFLGAVPHVVLATMPVHMSNIVFIALFVGIRHRMVATQSAARAAADGMARQARARVEAEHRERVSRMLHDEVLSVLTAAFHTRGEPSPQLRGAAGRALSLLSAPLVEPAPGSEAGSEAGDVAVNRLVGAVTAIDPRCHVTSSYDDHPVPIAVTDAIIGAASEAMRNSVRHAGSETARTFTVHAGGAEFTAAVHDEGCGFVPELVPPGALGISKSIIGRMHGLPGGSATISSRPGGPTTIQLVWRA